MGNRGNFWRQSGVILYKTKTPRAYEMVMLACTCNTNRAGILADLAPPQFSYGSWGPSGGGRYVLKPLVRDHTIWP
jgi:hypothetical protein